VPPWVDDRDMSLVAGTTMIPIAAGLVVAVVAFLGWAALAVRRQRTETVGVTTAPVVAGPAPTVRVPTVRVPTVRVPTVRVPTVRVPTVRVVVRPHYRVAAPDDAAVRAALMGRVQLPVPLAVPGDLEPVAAGLARTA
jgi:hypothetical protein